MKKMSSQDYLAASAIELISKYSADKITVSQIASNCNISTRTFYNYFKDKYDLFLWIYTRSLDSYFENTESKITFTDLMYYSGYEIWNNIAFFANIIKYKGQNNFKQAVFQPLYSHYVKIIEEQFGDPVSPDIEETLTFFTYGMIEYIARCFESNDIPDVSSAVSVFQKSIPSNLRKYL